MKTKYLILAISLIILSLSGCKKEKDLAAVFTVSDCKETVTATTAKLEATFSYPGNVKKVGVDVSENEDMSEAKHFEATVDGSKLNADVSGLKGNTLYYYRYGNNTGYGTVSNEAKTFKTKDYSLPKLTTSEVTDITINSAKCGGNITNDGEAEITERGVCWSKSQNPTIDGNHKSNGTGLGSYTIDIDGLEIGVEYHVRAYAKNVKGVSYGNENTFVTLNGVAAITTSDVTNITATTAKCGGNITNDGGSAITERGVCWSKSQNPTIDGNHKANGIGLGSYTIDIDGLEIGVQYYVRAYAKNEKGVSYGENISFQTLDGLPVIVTSSVIGITTTSAICGGEVKGYQGMFDVTERGVCWSKSQNPTIGNSHTTNGSGTGSFTSSITGLTANTTYYVRAYATYSAGTNYGEQKSFKTENGTHEYVDLGLPSGLLWATCNVGATNPKDFGYHIAWGETSPKSNYNWSTYQWCNGSETTLTKYNTNSSYGIVDNKTVLEPEDDAAHMNWGGDWRMPTQTDWQELYNNTTSQWTTQNGVYGRLFTSTVAGHTEVSLFLPAAGHRYGTSLSCAGSGGYYWCSSLCASYPDNAYHMYFSGNVNPQELSRRSYGYSVRPVRQP